MSEQQNGPDADADGAEPPAAAPKGAGVGLVDGPAAQFLAGVRAELADLPAGEVEEILDDVRAHLTDLADELGSDPDQDALTRRLGAPGTYAAELRTAAGYPPAPPPPPAAAPEPGLTAAHLAVAGLVASTVLVALGVATVAPAVVLLGAVLVLIALPALVRGGPEMSTVAGLPVVRRFTAASPWSGTGDRPLLGFIASLQPAWWVLRALLAAALVFAFLFGGGSTRVWALGVLLAAVVMVPLSVWLGFRSRRDRRLLWLVVPLNGVVVGLLLLVVVAVPMAGSSEPSPAYQVGYYDSGLWQEGAEITDIRPVDASGVPLAGVYLFDQDGRPIDTSWYGCDDTYSQNGFPAEPVRPYPRGTVQTDPNTGLCVVVPPGPLVVAVPTAVPATPSAGAGAPPTTEPQPATEVPTTASSAPAAGSTTAPVTAPPTTPPPAPPTG